jgi:capsular polysaccharide biosynthesis protein
VGVADVYRALWRRKAFILILTAGLVAAVWFLTQRETPIYEASTLIRVEQRIADPGQADRSLDVGQRLAKTYAKIAETTQIAQQVFTQLNSTVPFDQIKGKISAAPVQDLELLSISARNPDPKVARDIANATPPVLQLYAATGTLGDKVTTADPAQLPTSPASPNLTLNIALAVLLGLIFNGALALLIQVMSDRFADVEELERVTGRPVLATIPTLDFARGSEVRRPRATQSDATATAVEKV